MCLSYAIIDHFHPLSCEDGLLLLLLLLLVLLLLLSLPACPSPYYLSNNLSLGVRALERRYTGSSGLLVRVPFM